MNLLFTSAGRRDYLIEYFAAALGGRGRIHVGNCESLCSAFTVGDAHVVTPPIHDKDYLPFLRDYCRRQDIGAILPLFDGDLPVLAAARAEFAEQGVQVVVATPEMVEVCNDKWRMVECLRGAGLQTPLTFLDPESALEAVMRGDVAFPLIVKPRWGMGSIGLMQVDDADELRLMFHLVRRRIFASYLQFESASAPDACVLIQEQASGIEYSLDVLNDLTGRHVVTVAKRKLAMRAGETDVATTEDRPDLHALGARLAALLGHPGNLDVDVYVDGTHQTVLDLNCRFGGGYPFAHAAGANFPAAILAWLSGLEPEPQWLRAHAEVTAMKSICLKVLTFDPPVNSNPPPARPQGSFSK